MGANVKHEGLVVIGTGRIRITIYGQGFSQSRVLDHPNIAHVHDAGTTELGRRYFVMEYVKGLPIPRRRVGIAIGLSSIDGDG